MKDGLYRVSTPYLCAGFEVENGSVVRCAPILKQRIAYWVTVAELIREKQVMADLSFGGPAFDASKVEPNKVLEPIPAGWYNVKIIESERKPTSSTPPGEMLVLTLEVIDGEYAGRKLFDRLNIKNANQLAQEIAWGTLSSICRSTGVMQVQDSAQLHGIPMKAKVSLRPAAQGRDGNFYEANNDVKGYKGINETAPGAPGAPATAPTGGAPWKTATPPPTAPPPAAATGVKPWEAAPAAAPAPVAPPTPPPPAVDPNKFPPEAVTWAKNNSNHEQAGPILAWVAEVERSKAGTPPVTKPPWAK